MIANDFRSFCFSRVFCSFFIISVKLGGGGGVDQVFVEGVMAGEETLICVLSVKSSVSQLFSETFFSNFEVKVISKF